MTFGERLRKVREEANLTQAELSEAVGVSPAAYRNFEQGVNYPRFDIALKICTAVGCKISALDDRLCPADHVPERRTAGRPKDKPEPTGE